MNVRLIFHGKGFKATKEVEIPHIQEGMEMIFPLDDGFSAGAVHFRVDKLSLLLNFMIYEAEISKCDDSQEPKYGEFAAEGWTIE